MYMGLMLRKGKLPSRADSVWSFQSKLYQRKDMCDVKQKGQNNFAHRC